MAVVAPRQERARGLAGAMARARAALPRGDMAGPEVLHSRQRFVTWILWGHVAGLAAFGLAVGAPPTHLAAELLVVVALIVISNQSLVLSATVRVAVSALALMTCSALVVHLSGGSIEAHFHFFVMVAVIALYQHWVPFLVAIAFVALHHGVVGVLTPENVYDHAAATTSPVRWALIHAAFVLAASAAQVVSWRLAEDEHDRARASLEARERRFRALIEHSLDAVCIVTEEGEILYESESSQAVLGYVAGERHGASSFAFVHPDDMEVALGLITAAGEAPGSVATAELRARHADGSWRWIDARATNLIDDPDVRGIVANYRDVTERRRLAEELAHQATHDPLTGLANRTLFLERLEVAAGGDEPIALLFVDVDDFKVVNDALGHLVGDELLRELGRRLRGAAREGDTCARLGGDEFALLLGGPVDEVDARLVGEAVLAALRGPVALSVEEVTLTASVGIVVSSGGRSGEQLMRDADLAMYEAKRSGKGRSAVFRPAMLDAAVDRLALREDLHRALVHGELVNEYQPIVDLRSGEVVGVEALVRWRHPTRGLLLPGAFVGLAEEKVDLILPLGQGVLERACRDAAAWPAAGRPTVSVNLSARQVLEPGLVGVVADALRDSGLAPDRLVLEVTESVLVDDPDGAAATLADLKALGVSLALDDFGTGFSSLSYLARFPVDILKIDRSFIEPLAGAADDDHVAVVAAIIDMARRLRLRVTAEGVEQQVQADLLLRLGCTHAQGYLLGRPRAGKTVADLLRGPAPAR